MSFCDALTDAAEYFHRQKGRFMRISSSFDTRSDFEGTQTESTAIVDETLEKQERARKALRFLAEKQLALSRNLRRGRNARQ